MPNLPQTLPASASSATIWLRPSVLALIAANVVPLLGVLWFGWKVFPLLMVLKIALDLSAHLKEREGSPPRE
jgi:hypothetical protein